MRHCRYTGKCSFQGDAIFKIGSVELTETEANELLLSAKSYLLCRYKSYHFDKVNGTWVYEVYKTYKEPMTLYNRFYALTKEDIDKY